MEAIIAGTALGGELMMHPHELGKVLPGYYADLILVHGNPLDDISILSHHENLDVIMIVSGPAIIYSFRVESKIRYTEWKGA